MFFSRLGPATAAHSAYREKRPLSTPGHSTWESWGQSSCLQSSPHASLSISTQRSISPSLPSYLEKLAMILDTEGGASEETERASER